MRLFRPRVILAVIMSVLLLTGGVAAVTQIATWTDSPSSGGYTGVTVHEPSTTAYYVDGDGVSAHDYDAGTTVFSNAGPGSSSETHVDTDGDYVVYGSGGVTSTSVVILDVADQTTTTISTNAAIKPRVAIHDGSVYVTYENDAGATRLDVYALDTGTEQSSMQIASGGIPEGIDVGENGNGIVATDNPSRLISADPASGTVNWDYAISGGDNLVGYDPFTDRIYLGDQNGDIKRFDGSTGTVTKSYTAFSTGDITSLQAASDHAIAGTSAGDLEIRDMSNDVTEVREDGYDSGDAWVGADSRTAVAVGQDSGQGTAWDLEFEVPQPVDVTVQYENGTTIADANVTITDDSDGSTVATGQTDASGVFSTSIPDGNYTAEATKTNHTVDTATFTVAGSGESVTLTLQEIGEETELNLHLDRWMPHNSSQPYVVTFTNETGQRSNVTTQADVTSDNASVVTVDSANYELDSTSNESVAARANITANYTSNGVEYSATDYVAVANVTTSNLKILPPAQRLQGTVTDDTIYVIIIAAMLSVAATRFSSAFGGLSMGTMTMVVGYLGGYVGEGIAMLSLFTALFIGLNLAANIDYTVRR